MFGLIQNAVVGLLASVYGITRSGVDLVLTAAGSAAFVILKFNNKVSFRRSTDDTPMFEVTSTGDAFVVGRLGQGGTTEGGSATRLKAVGKKTGIADNTATAFLTVTVPNAAHAAAIKVRLLSSNGSTDAFESSRVAEGLVVLARTAGANVVATATALTSAGIATVSGGATHTLAYDLSAISGAVGATNTFTVRVTIDDGGNLGSNQLVYTAEVLNAESSGVTIAAA